MHGNVSVVVDDHNTGLMLEIEQSKLLDMKYTLNICFFGYLVLLVLADQQCQCVNCLPDPIAYKKLISNKFLTNFLLNRAWHLKPSIWRWPFKKIVEWLNLSSKCWGKLLDYQVL
ncbi:hypothetical protein C2S52_004796 [Perilla frutescens var. hirtella]|nr:hypothetical protein C2S51_010817 [Perilla frutescens var. frutescens]KAH6794319.1 hypothetical protein C2S52_004796 [Perilla frutescens var. hirtella]